MDPLLEFALGLSWHLFHIPLALFLANATEWSFHRRVLHGLGRRRESFWSFHWHEHHNLSRKHEFRDPHYERSVWEWNAQGKEALALLLGSLAVTPLLPWAPVFVLTSWYAAAHYHAVHKRSHMDPAWARAHLPWHYDHHMGPDQDANWCVTWPWFDLLMGTRVPYAGTQREAADIARRAQRRTEADERSPTATAATS